MTVSLVFTADATAHQVDKTLLGDSGSPNFTASGHTPAPNRQDVTIQRSGSEIRVRLEHLDDCSELSGANANTDTEAAIIDSMPKVVSHIVTEES